MGALFALGLAILICLPPPADAAPPNGNASISPGNFNSCMQGETWAAYDGCHDAIPNATFQDQNLVTEYFLDADGNPATIYHPMDYNMAGRDFGVGPPKGAVYKDPAYMSFSSTGSAISGSILTVGTVVSGHVGTGLVLWSPVGNSYAGHPKIRSCDGTGSDGRGSGARCTLDAPQGTVTSRPINGSTMPGCEWRWNGLSTSLAQWYCDFRHPNEGLSGNFDYAEWGAVGGHPATTFRIGNSGDGTVNPSVHIWYAHYLVDHMIDAKGGFMTVITGGHVNLDFEHNECDGGDDGAAANPNPNDLPYWRESSCLNWGARGRSGGIENAVHIKFKYNYVHDFAGNAIVMELGWNDIQIQGNVFKNVGINNGDNPSGSTCNDSSHCLTGIHGATIQFGTTAVGAHLYNFERYNDTVIYRPGFRAGATTAAFALLGGVGSAIKLDSVKLGLTTLMVNKSSGSQAVMGSAFFPFRIAGITNLHVFHNFWNTRGMNGTVGIGADMQNMTIVSSVSDPTTKRSTVQFGTFGVQTPIAYPGQGIAHGPGSRQPAFTATLTNLGNNTSRMNITHTYVGNTSALAPDTQIIALRLNDPTLIVSGSGTSYIVKNADGGPGEDRAEQTFIIAHKLLPFGTDGTTADGSVTGGNNPTGYNGTWRMTGPLDVTNSTGWFAVTTPTLGNVATIDADISDNWDPTVAGDNGRILVNDGPGLGGFKGHCPNCGAN